jgi:hypothetical protein
LSQDLQLFLSAPVRTFLNTLGALGGGSEGGGAGQIPPSDEPPGTLEELLLDAYLSVVGSKEEGKSPSQLDLRKDVLTQLKAGGYDYLARRWASLHSSKRELLKVGRTADLMEVLLAITDQVEEMRTQAEQRRSASQITDFASILAAMANSPATAQLGMRGLGRLLFCLDRDGAEVAEHLSLDTFEDSLDYLEKSIARSLALEHRSLLNIAKLHSETGLQSAERALQVQIPNTVASILLCKDGTVNALLVPDVKEQLGQLLPKDHACYARLTQVLDRLEGSPAVRNAFRELKLPDQAHPEGQKLLRVALGLRYEQRLQDQHLRQAVLSAMLTRMRQGESRSCFASALAIVIHTSSSELFVHDLASLLAQGGLKRPSERGEERFPLLMRMGPRNAGRVCLIDRRGCLYEGSPATRPFWEAPGFIAACEYLELQSPEEAGRQVYRRLFSAYMQGEPKDGAHILGVTVEDLLRGLIRLDQSVDASQEDRILDDLNFVYEAQTSPALLRVWENAIAMMAEVSGQTINRPHVIECVLFALSRKGHAIFGRNSQEWERLCEALKASLNARVQLVFDPSVKGTQSLDGISSQGAWRLCDRQILEERGAYSEAIIATPYEFQDFVARVVRDVRELVPSSEREVDPLSELEAYVYDPSFIWQSTRKFCFHKVKDPIAEHHKLEMAPWLIKAGSNFVDTLQVYFGLNERPQMDWAYCPNGTALLKEVVKQVRRYLEWVERSPHPRMMIPARAQGKHAFNLILNAPSILEAVRTDDLEKWLGERWLRPGSQLSRMRIGGAGSKLTAFCLGGLIDELGRSFPEAIQWKSRSRYHCALRSLKAVGSIAEFRNKLLKTVFDELALKDQDAKEFIQVEIDQELIRVLPEHQRRWIEQSAVCFADTGHEHRESSRNIHFFFIYNPGSERIELAQMKGNRTEIAVLSQREWLEERNWEFCIPPAEIGDE